MVQIKEDFEFYKNAEGKITCDKVTTFSKSGKLYRTTAQSDADDDTLAVKRIPFNQLDSKNKEIARIAYKKLRDEGLLNKVGDEFDITNPDVVVSAAQDKLKIYYDKNKSGIPDKIIPLAASRKRSPYEEAHLIKEALNSESNKATYNSMVKKLAEKLKNLYDKIKDHASYYTNTYIGETLNEDIFTEFVATLWGIIEDGNPYNAEDVYYELKDADKILIKSINEDDRNSYNLKDIDLDQIKKEFDPIYNSYKMLHRLHDKIFTE